MEAAYLLIFFERSPCTTWACANVHVPRWLSTGQKAAAAAAPSESALDPDRSCGCGSAGAAVPVDD